MIPYKVYTETAAKKTKHQNGGRICNRLNLYSYTHRLEILDAIIHIYWTSTIVFLATMVFKGTGLRFKECEFDSL